MSLDAVCCDNVGSVVQAGLVYNLEFRQANVWKSPDVHSSKCSAFLRGRNPTRSVRTPGGGRPCMWPQLIKNGYDRPPDLNI